MSRYIDDPGVDGVAKILRSLLPSDQNFVLLTFDRDGKYQHVIDGNRHDAIAHLRNATRVLQNREDV